MCQGFAELRLILRNARKAAGSPEAALRELAEAYVGFALEHPALYDAMFTLSTELPFGRPEAQPEPRRMISSLQKSRTPAISPMKDGRGVVQFLVPHQIKPARAAPHPHAPGRPAVLTIPAPGRPGRPD